MSTGPASGRSATLGVSFWRTGARVALLLLVLLLPSVVASMLWWPGTASVGAFGLLVGLLGALYGGARTGVALSVAMAVAGDVGILVRDSPWLVAALMVVCGVAYGVSATRGLQLAFAAVAFLVPYFVMKPPALFTAGAPSVDLAYLAGVALVVALNGVWVAFLTVKLLNGKTLHAPTVPKELALRHGLVLGTCAAVAAVVSIQWIPDAHWAWVTLTLYVLANPTGVWDRTKYLYRVLGTVGGFLIAAAVFAVAPGSWFINLTGLIALWLAVVMRFLRKPYWVYVMFLTPTMVLLDSFGYRDYGLAAQRLEFTLIGAVLAVAATGLADFWFGKGRTSEAAGG